MNAKVANVTSTGSHGGGFGAFAIILTGLFGKSMLNRAGFNGVVPAHGGPGATGLNDNGNKVLRVGDIYLCPIHGPNPIVTGSTVWFHDGKAIARQGDHMACGAIITPPVSPEWSST